MKILHLISDHQVIERTLGVFEKVFPGCNDVIVFSKESRLRHLKNYTPESIVAPGQVKRFASEFSFNGIDYVVSHYMSIDKIDFIKHVPLGIHVCWEIYGADLYNQFLAPMGYPLQFKDYYHQDETHFITILRKIGFLGIIDWLFYGNKVSVGVVRNQYFNYIINRINSISVCCKGDAEVLELYSGKRFTVFKAFNYSLQETLGELYGTPFYESNGVLIGNSASFTNNHLYVVGMLKELCLCDRKLIIPLSYGGNKAYKEDVVRKYNDLFPNQVEFLMDYMPLHEYNKLFLKINIMVLSSWRQESIGTIFMGLYLGIKIYMSQKSPLYRSLREEGFMIYEIENTTKEEFNKSLTLMQKAYNRDLLLKNYNEQVFEDELRRQFN